MGGDKVVRMRWETWKACPQELERMAPHEYCNGRGKEEGEANMVGGAQQASEGCEPLLDELPIGRWKEVPREKGSSGQESRGVRTVLADQARAECPQEVAKTWARSPGLTGTPVDSQESEALLTFSLCRELFSSPSTCRSFFATPMQGRSVRTPRWQATPKPARDQGSELDGGDEMENQLESLIQSHRLLSGSQADRTMNEALF